MCLTNKLYFPSLPYCTYRILRPSLALGADALRVVTDYEQAVENINLALNISTAANDTATMAYQQVGTSVMYTCVWLPSSMLPCTVDIFDRFHCTCK